MFVSIETILKFLSLITGLAAAVALVWKFFKWVNHQKEQDEAIAELKTQQTNDKQELKSEIDSRVKALEAKHDREVAEIKATDQKFVDSIQEELTLTVYGLLACLQGLNDQGCGDPIPKTIDKINKYLNQKAHDRK